MNKIAAYEIALENIELEKRADYLVDAYGTCQGEMPVAYLRAFDQIEKEAGLQAIGQGITKGIYSLGKALGGAGASGARTGLGGKMMDFASRVGGKSTSGASMAALKNVKSQVPGATTAGYLQGRRNAQGIIGGAALGTAGVGAVGLGRMTKR